MPIKLNCPHCDKGYNLPDASRGKTLRCKQCQGTFTVEDEASEAIETGLKKSQALQRLLDDDDKPKAKKKSSGFPVFLMFGALFGVLVVCGLPCGIGLYLFNAGVHAVDDAVKEQNARAKGIFDDVNARTGPKVDPKLPPMDQALAKLAGDDPGPQEEACNWLFKDAKPDESKKREVSRRLEHLLRNSTHHGVLASAARATEIWGTPECTDPLIALVDHGDGRVRSAAMETLGNLKEAKAAEPIAARLPHDHDQAQKALTSIGPVAEPYVVKFFNHDRVSDRAAPSSRVTTRRSPRSCRSAWRM